MRQETLQKTPEDRASEFVPDQGGGDNTSAELLLVIAYLAMWTVLIGFVFLSWRRQQRIDGRLAEIERAIKASASGGPRA